MGATPVPGPTRTRGVSALAGRRNVLCTCLTVPINTSPAVASWAVPLPGPRCTRPDGATYSTRPTEMVTRSLPASRGEELML